MPYGQVVYNRQASQMLMFRPEFCSFARSRYYLYDARLLYQIDKTTNRRRRLCTLIRLF